MWVQPKLLPTFLTLFSITVFAQTVPPCFVAHNGIIAVLGSAPNGDDSWAPYENNGTLNVLPWKQLNATLQNPATINGVCVMAVHPQSGADVVFVVGGNNDMTPKTNALAKRTEVERRHHHHHYYDDDYDDDYDDGYDGDYYDSNYEGIIYLSGFRSADPSDSSDYTTTQSSSTIVNISYDSGETPTSTTSSDNSLISATSYSHSASTSSPNSGSPSSSVSAAMPSSTTVQITIGVFDWSKKAWVSPLQINSTNAPPITGLTGHISAFIPVTNQLFVFLPSDPSGGNMTGAFLFNFNTSTWTAYGSPDGIPALDFTGASVSVLADKVLLFGVGNGLQKNIYFLEDGVWNTIVSPLAFLAGGGLSALDTSMQTNQTVQITLNHFFYVPATMDNMTQWTFSSGESGVKANNLPPPSNKALYKGNPGTGAIMSDAGNGYLFLFNTAAQKPLSIYDANQQNWTIPNNQLALSPSPSNSSDAVSKVVGPVIAGVFGTIAVSLGVAGIILIRKRKIGGDRVPHDDDEKIIAATTDRPSDDNSMMNSISSAPVSLPGIIRSNSRRIAKGVGAFLFGDTGPTSELIKEFGRDIKKYDASDYKEATPDLADGLLLFGRYKFGPEAATTLTSYLSIRSAQDITNNEPVVIKFFRSEFMFIKDVAVSEYLRSPYVVSVSEKFILPEDVTTPRFIAVTEFSPASLDRVLHGLEVSDPLFTKLTTHSLLECVYWLHHKKIAHLNVRPACFYHEWGDVTTWKIGHFVSSRVIVEDHIDWDVVTLSRYSAPELVARQGEVFLTVQASMDMWSLGCVLFELASGRCLFEHVNDVRTHTSAKNWSPPLEEISSPNIRRIIEGLLQVDPKLRMDINAARELISAKEDKEEIISENEIASQTAQLQDISNLDRPSISAEERTSFTVEDGEDQT